MELISCQNVALKYQSYTVCDNLNFVVNDGDYLCIVGENGSGKSTLVNALLSLKECSEGKITFADGFDVSQIGYLPQTTQIEKDFPASVFEVVLSGCLAHTKGSFYKAEQKKQAQNAIDLLNINDIKKKSFSSLSGGQKQRVLLARALCAAKKVLLLDEPISGLDPKASANMYDIINTLNREHKMTVIVVSHDLDAAFKYATHILHINHSSSFFGTTEEYKASSISKNYIGGH